MKKSTIGFLATGLILAFQPLKTKASEKVTTGHSVVVLNDSAEAGKLLSRLNEIKLMSKSDLDPVQKKNLRKEVRSIKNRLNQMAGGGVYLSVGAIIIIILLLVILF